jgi:hypothetical protein
MLDKLKQLDLTPKDFIIALLFPTLALLLAGWLGSISVLHIDWLKLAEIGVVIFTLLSWMRLKLKMRAEGVKLRKEYEDLKDGYRQDVATTKEELTRIINSHSTNFSNWIIEHAYGHGREQKEFKRQLDALEQKLKDKKML